MNQTDLIREIIATYKKHDLQLRRVLLTEETQKKIGDSLSVDAPINISAINALWFSRPSRGGEAWELRSISATPFALFESFSPDISEEEREKMRGEMEQRLKERGKSKNAE